MKIKIPRITNTAVIAYCIRTASGSLRLKLFAKANFIDLEVIESGTTMYPSALIVPNLMSFLEEILGEKCIRTSNVSKILDVHTVLNCAIK